MAKENKNIPKLVTFTPKMAEMIDEIQEKKGYISFSAVIHQAVIELHKGYFPAYVQKDSSAIGKMKRKDEEKKAKIELHNESLIGICEELGGKIKDKNGTPICTYYTYSHKKRYEQSIPVEQLTEDLPKNQYSPSKAKVEQLQKAKKVDY